VNYIDSNKKRPISPHLGIYKPQISSVLSILHRMSGVVNYLGLLVMVWWMVILAFSIEENSDEFLRYFFGSNLGLIIIIGWTFSLLFHMCTGIRHLAWDLGYGFDVKVMTITGIIAIAVAVILTLSFWILTLMQLNS
jgi:succinate dehydrogenase / fumarate reductase, cytochrome b subunit